MAGFAITLALLLVGIICVPFRLWASRIGMGSRSRPRLVNRCRTQSGLEGLRACSRDLLVLIDRLRRLVPEYRSTLPYVSLFFADRRQGLHVRRDRWIVCVRRDFEVSVEELAIALRKWWRMLETLEERDRMVLDAAGGVPSAIHRMLGDVANLPRNTVEARRWRFCEETELAVLMAMLGALGDELARLELSLSARGALLYR